MSSKAGPVFVINVFPPPNRIRGRVGEGMEETADDQWVKSLGSLLTSYAISAIVLEEEL